MIWYPYESSSFMAASTHTSNIPLFNCVSIAIPPNVVYYTTHSIMCQAVFFLISPLRQGGQVPPSPNGVYKKCGTSLF